MIIVENRKEGCNLPCKNNRKISSGIEKTLEESNIVTAVVICLGTMNEKTLTESNNVTADCIRRETITEKSVLACVFV